MSTQDILQGLNSLYVDVSELPPQMRNLACAVANCQLPTISLVKVSAGSATFFEPTCGNHGGGFSHASGSIREAQRQVREQLQREQDELRQWQQQQKEHERATQQDEPQPRSEPPTAPAIPEEPRVCRFGHTHVAGDTTFESCSEVFDKIKEYRDRTWQAVRLAANHGMLVGRHYKLTYQEDWPHQWPPKHVGASWFGEFTGESETEYQINAGTGQGSGSLPKHWVYEILEVPVGHAMFIQRFQGPGR
jgi:hypothetical protein